MFAMIPLAGNKPSPHNRFNWGAICPAHCPQKREKEEAQHTIMEAMCGASHGCRSFGEEDDVDSLFIGLCSTCPFSLDPCVPQKIPGPENLAHGSPQSIRSALLLGRR